MATPGLDADHLAAARRADPLLGRLVALDLRHRCLTLLWLPAPGARTIRCFSWPALRRSLSVVSASFPTREPALAPPLRRPAWPRALASPQERASALLPGRRRRALPGMTPVPLRPPAAPVWSLPVPLLPQLLARGPEHRWVPGPRPPPEHRWVPGPRRAPQPRRVRPQAWPPAEPARAPWACEATRP